MKWDASIYKDNFSFVHKYGESVLELIKLPRDSKKNKAVDLGCGQGELTAQLKKLGYDVIGIDSSSDQIKKACENYKDIKFIQADMTDFKLSQPVDLVFSNAAFHWLTKEENRSMLANVYSSLNSGGQLVFEMGGFRNNYLIHEALEEVFLSLGYEYQTGFYFPTISEYSTLIESSGLLVTDAKLFKRDTVLEGDKGLYNWIDYFVDYPFRHASINEADLREEIISQAVAKLKPALFNQQGYWLADYVRLRIRAVKMD